MLGEVPKNGRPTYSDSKVRLGWGCKGVCKGVGLMFVVTQLNSKETRCKLKLLTMHCTAATAC